MIHHCPYCGTRIGPSRLVVLTTLIIVAIGIGAILARVMGV